MELRRPPAQMTHCAAHHHGAKSNNFSPEYNTPVPVTEDSIYGNYALRLSGIIDLIASHCEICILYHLSTSTSIPIHIQLKQRSKNSEFRDCVD